MGYIDGSVARVPKKKLEAYAASRGRPARSGGSTARS